MVFVPKPNPNMSTVLFEKKQKVEHKGTWSCKLSGVLKERTWLTLILAVGLNLWNKTCDLFIMKYSLTVDINFKQLDQKASLFSPLRFKRGWKSFPTFRKEWEENFEGIGYVVNRRVLQENRSFWTCLPETCSTIHELSGIVLSDMWRIRCYTSYKRECSFLSTKSMIFSKTKPSVVVPKPNQSTTIWQYYNITVQKC